MLIQVLRRATPFLLFFLLGLAVLSLSRLGLSLWQADAIRAVDGWRQVLLQGIRVDIAAMCLLLGLLACFYLLLPDALVRNRYVSGVVALWLVVALSSVVMLELSTPAFMQEYGLRPNRLYLEYLIYPREVVSTLIKGHPVSTVLSIFVTVLVACGLWWLARATLRIGSAARSPWGARAALAMCVLVLSVLGVRSSLGHRPMNPAMLAFSSNATVNVLPLNSFYSVAFAARDLIRKDPGSRVYGSLPDDVLIAAIRETVAASGAELVESDFPVSVRRAPFHDGPRRNLVIILQESLGAQFIGALGGRPLSPHIDQLYDEGWAFDRLYATGTRSVRGIEAVLTGFTPTPSQAVVKRSLSQQDFFTLAQLLRDYGYDTTFYYGGESHFDNMRGFFLGNGFERVIDQKDYTSPVFVGSWGVSDEDLMARAHQEFERMHEDGQPFFGFVFSSSNHDPFEFPDGRIELYEQPKATRDNAAKYADYAVGAFFDKARQSDYWDNTVFLVIADHDSRVFGRELVPIENFHIPGVIVGAGIEPYRDGRIVSQIDIPPTLLSLIGIGAATPLLGNDLTHKAAYSPGRALMQYDNNFALMKGNDVVILQPQQPPRYFRYATGSGMQPAPEENPGMGQEALVKALWGTQAYENRWHQMPGRALEVAVR